MSALRLLGFAALLASPVAHADGAVKLYCAVNATGFFDAEMQLREEGPNFVNVTFMRTRPSKMVVDWALRDCLATAAKLNGARGIVALAWFRSLSKAGLQPLEPYSRRWLPASPPARSAALRSR
jgi:hypothetical protein